VLIYLVLAIPWPGLTSAYTGLFQSVGNVMLPTYGNVAYVSFRPPPAPQARWDTEIHVRPFNRTDAWHLEMSARGWSYLPTIAFASLVLASPIGIRTRLAWLILGLFVVHLFIVVRVLIAVHYTLYSGGAIEMSSWASRMWKLLFESVSASTVVTFLTPTMIWLACVAIHVQLRRSGSRQSLAVRNGR